MAPHAASHVEAGSAPAVGASRVTWLSAPIIDQTNGLCPCASIHGW
jgi:hypothetical protein